MTRMAITGHRGLPTDVTDRVTVELRALVDGHADGELTAVSCIADGPDSLFARFVLDAGGALVVIVPAARYRDGLPIEHHATYDALHACAAHVINLDHVESTSEAHMDASLRMLDEADHLVAVWDGQPARGFGGTADVVAAARERGMPVTVVWPDGATRD
ncbi:hypothetical protein GCM10009676_31050 [Prauserella halophila]|uniref:Uncharacterized protein n=1 Tax=Prauserella halophila TaxID=185641 RepID=A0ABP4H319_9PSEU|nr:hypothetical protein [Prauserella halophila]MCP2234733.1 hypothetical protein [Prauserella halophila]